MGRLLIAHVSGIHRCGSPWSCPTCAPVVRARRAQEIDLGLSGWLGAGHGAAFVTTTVRHTVKDGLDGRMDLMSTANRELHKGRPWGRTAEQLGYVGAIKAVEVLRSQRNGWHPHMHGLWLFEQPLSAADVAGLERQTFDRWSTVVARRGFGTVTRENGVDVRNVTDGDSLAGYLTKVESGWSAGSELAKMHKKSSRSGMQPLELLVELVATGESKYLRWWQQYEAATFGRSAITWSPGLRQLLGVGQEKSDVELAASEGVDETVLTWLIEAALWRAALREGSIGEGLDELEDHARTIFALNDAAGLETPATTYRIALPFAPKQFVNSA